MSQTISNVYYNIPQDKDDPDIPNVFCIPKAQEEIRLADIKQYFPLNGQYIFRFKYKYNNQVVWMDIPENSKKLPIFDGRIFVKATRICWGEQKKVAQEQVQANTQQNTSSQNKSNNVNNQRPASNQQYIDFFGDDDHSHQKDSNQKSSNSQQGSNLLDFDN